MKALIVAHGQPSDPEPAQAALGELACAVAGHLPGWDIRFATLALPGALARAVAGGPGVVYPMFMAGGWFTKVELPRRMALDGAEGWTHLPPFGLDPDVQDLCVTLAREAGATEILLAAHGSGRSRVPAEVTEAMAARLRAEGFPATRAFYIEEEPRIATAEGFSPGAICLPFFAAEGGHVTGDLPEALAEARFPGRTLPPLGLDPRVPGLIAAALRRSADKGATPAR